MSEKNNNTFEATVSSLFQGMDQFISSKTVVGDAITIGNTIILPLVDVTFGVGAGAAAPVKKRTTGAEAWEARYHPARFL